MFKEVEAFVKITSLLKDIFREVEALINMRILFKDNEITRLFE
jgi:hypothetical protein